MLYRLERDEFAEHGLRRVVLEEVDCAVVRIADPEADVHETVHEVRKGCKRIRAALYGRSFSTCRAGSDEHLSIPHEQTLPAGYASAFCGRCVKAAIGLRSESTQANDTVWG